MLRSPMTFTGWWLAGAACSFRDGAAGPSPHGAPISVRVLGAEPLSVTLLECGIERETRAQDPATGAFEFGAVSCAASDRGCVTLRIARQGSLTETEPLSFQAPRGCDLAATHGVSHGFLVDEAGRAFYRATP